MTLAPSKVAYSIVEAAAATGVSAKTISRAMNAKEAADSGFPFLPSKRLGTRTRLIDADDLRSWVKSLEDA